MRFVDLEKAFDRVPRRVTEWARRKKGLPEILVKAVMSLYEGAERKVKSWIGLVRRIFCESWCTPRICVVTFVVCNSKRSSNRKCKARLDEANSLCRRFGPNGETMEELRENFDEWRETFESKGMRVNLGKTKLMVSGMEVETLYSKIDPCGVCGTKVMSNSVLCTACGKWVHTRCTDKKKVLVYLNKDFV